MCGKRTQVILTKVICQFILQYNKLNNILTLPPIVPFIRGHGTGVVLTRTNFSKFLIVLHCAYANFIKILEAK